MELQRLLGERGEQWRGFLEFQGEVPTEQDKVHSVTCAEGEVCLLL